MIRAILILLALTTPAHADPVSIGAAITGIASWWASIGAVGQAVIGLGIAIAATGISYLLNGGQRLANASNQNLPSINVPERDGLLERCRLYGIDTTPGGVFFQKTVSDGLQDNLNIYVFGVAVSEGVCDGLEAVIINGVRCRINSFGEPIDAPWFDGSIAYFKVSFRPGTDTQAIDPIIAARFPSEDPEFRQRGVCTVVMEMQFGADSDKQTELWGSGGIPQLLFQIRGLQVYDPRDPTQDPSDKSTWKWSDNASLVQLDWLNCEIGFDIPFIEIDLSSVVTSANIDDLPVPTLAGLEANARCSGRAFSSESNADVLDSMTQQNRALVRRSDGIYTIKSRMVGEQPVSTIHQDMLVGDMSYQNEPDTRAAINTVKIEFRPTSRFNQSAETVYQDAAMVTQDGQVLEQRISLRFCDSAPAAQRIGYALLMENRSGRTLSKEVDIAALVAAGNVGKMLQIGDVVTEYMRNYQALNGEYMVDKMEITTGFTMQLSLNGYDPMMIDGWSVALEVPFE